MSCGVDVLDSIHVAVMDRPARRAPAEPPNFALPVCRLEAMLIRRSWWPKEQDELPNTCAQSDDQRDGQAPPLAHGGT